MPHQRDSHPERPRHRHRWRPRRAARPPGSSPSGACACGSSRCARPAASPAHHTADLGELVCSNSLKSENPDSAAGLAQERARCDGQRRAWRWHARRAFPRAARWRSTASSSSRRSLTGSSVSPQRRRRPRRGRRASRRARHRRHRSADQPGVRSRARATRGPSGSRSSTRPPRSWTRSPSIARSSSRSRATTRARRADYLNAPMTRESTTRSTTRWSRPDASRPRSSSTRTSSRRVSRSRRSRARAETRCASER